MIMRRMMLMLMMPNLGDQRRVLLCLAFITQTLFPAIYLLTL